MRHPAGTRTEGLREGPWPHRFRCLLLLELGVRLALVLQSASEAVRGGAGEAGAAGVRMYNADGIVAPESRRAIPTPWVAACKMLGFTKRYYMSHLSWDEPGQIQVVSGAFFMVRRQALDQVGLLDEDFFMYGEDIDLSYRLLKGGWQNWYLPYSIIHYKGQSTQKSDFRYVHVFYQAMLIFFRKHYSHLSFFFTMPVKCAIYFRASLALADIIRKKLHLG